MASTLLSTSDAASVQRTVILSVDPTVINDHHIGSLQYDFKHLTLNLLVFFESHECSNYLQQNPDESFILIVGESNGDEIVRICLSSVNLHRLYIVCSNPSQHPSWTISVGQSVPFFLVDVTSLSYRIRMDDGNERSTEVSFDVLSSSSSLSTDGNLTNKQDGTFMYGQLVKYLLTEMSYTKENMDNLIKFIEEKCSSRRISEQFRQHYTSDKALLYYTTETLFYSVLNGALRTCNFAVIYTMGIFIKDLHNALVKLHKPLNKNEILHLYRGQVLLGKDFERIRSNIGGLMSINQFLSTSTSRDVAEMFAMGGQYGKIGVLFHMTVDESMSQTVSFANIKPYSKFKDEDEYLFTMGSVFRIHAVEKINDKNIWRISLALTNDQDKEIASLTDFHRKEMKSLSLSSLCLVLVKMQEYDRLDMICEIGLKLTKNTKELYLYHVCSGVANCICGNASRGKEQLNMAQSYADGFSSSDMVFDQKSWIQVIMKLIEGDTTSMYSLVSEHLENESMVHSQINEELFSNFLFFNGILAEINGNTVEAKLNYSKALYKMRAILPSLHPQLVMCQEAVDRSQSYDGKSGTLEHLSFGLNKVLSRASLPDNPIKALLESMCSPLERVSTYSQLTSSHVDDNQQVECLESSNRLIRQAVLNHRQNKPDETISATNEFFQSSKKMEQVPVVVSYEMRRMEMESYKERGQHLEALNSLHEMENVFDSCPLLKNVLTSMTLLERADIFAAQNDDEETFKTLDQYRTILSSNNCLGGKLSTEQDLKSLVNRFLLRGHDHFERKNFYEAIAAYEKALKILLDFMVQDYDKQISAYIRMGQSCFELEDYSSALTNFYKVVNLADRVLLLGKVHVAAFWAIIGMSHLRLKEYDAFLVAYNNQQEILSMDPWSNRFALADSHKTVALVFLMQGKFEDSIDHLQKALEYHRNYSDTICPKTAEILKLLADAYRLQKNFTESLFTYEQTLELYMTNFTAEPEILADLYKNMGVVHMEVENFPEALVKLKECLKIHMTIGSSCDLILALMDHCTGYLLFREKRYVDCLNQIERVSQVYLKYPEGLATLMEAFSKLIKDAILEVQRLVQIEEDAQDQILVHEDLLQTLMEKGDLPKALFHAEKLLQIQVSVFPQNDLMIMRRLGRLSQLFLACQRFADASKSLEYCIPIGMKYLPKTISQLITILNLLGGTYMETAQYENAISSYEDLLEFQLNIRSADHLDIAETYQKLGLAYLNMEQIDEAQSNFLKCLDIRTKKLPNDHPDLIKTRQIVQHLF